jgi:hypothetical protein
MSNPPGSGGSPALSLIPSSVIRQGDHPELPAPLPGILEGYLTIMAGAGGVGKTFLAEQIARHIGSGVQLGRFPLPDEGPAVTWCLFLEDVAALTQQRSLDIAELGSLLEDTQPADSGADTIWYCDDSLRGIASLRARLQEAKEAGDVQGGPRLPELIIIDYLHLFIGSQPAGASPVEWGAPEADGPTGNGDRIRPSLPGPDAHEQGRQGQRDQRIAECVRCPLRTRSEGRPELRLSDVQEDANGTHDRLRAGPPRERVLGI